ncbi:MAG TPA: hypothetical protein VJC37_08300 [Planctomycetota bacterium]|nr:hypothetical protein [Planctomycetota bacterium]
MKSLINIFTVVLLIAAVAGLVYGFGFSKYDVLKPAEKEGAFPETVTMTEPNLMDQMCYDGITRDNDGNLLIKAREKACST